MSDEYLKASSLCTSCYLNSFDEFCHLLKEVRVRFVGFGAEEDEWLNVKKAVRQRSVPLEHSECHTVKVGDVLLCFQVTQIALFYLSFSEMVFILVIPFNLTVCLNFLGEKRSSNLLWCSCFRNPKETPWYKRLQVSFLDSVWPWQHWGKYCLAKCICIFQFRGTTSFACYEFHINWHGSLLLVKWLSKKFDLSI